MKPNRGLRAIATDVHGKLLRALLPQILLISTLQFALLAPSQVKAGEPLFKPPSESPARWKLALDLNGSPVDPIERGAPRAIVLVFISNDCPIANRYAPEISRLQARFDSKGVRFWLVHPNSSESAESIRRHTAEYHLNCAVVRDPEHVLVRRAKVQVTPEAAVFSPNGDLIYHGRIDDRFVAFGKTRPEPTQHDLEQVLNAVVAGKAPAHAERPAIGCYISDGEK